MCLELMYHYTTCGHIIPARDDQDAWVHCDQWAEGQDLKLHRAYFKLHEGQIVVELRTVILRARCGGLAALEEVGTRRQ